MDEPANDGYRIDVALSYLQEDEPLALAIVERIRDRVTLNIFLYSERQGELAGADGMENFSRVFGRDARLVVVLYRDKWGQTNWTRIEETAIKTRGFDEGFEFVLLVRLDSAKPPRWLPPTRIWLGFERYGIDGVASVVEERVQCLGGTVRNATVIDHAAKLGREISIREKVATWRTSPEGTADAERETDLLVGEFRRVVEGIRDEIHGVRIDINAISTGHGVFYVSYPQKYIGIEYETRSLWKLEMTLFYREFEKARRGFGDSIEIETEIYDLDCNEAMQIGWRNSDGDRKFFTAAQLVEHWLKSFLTLIRRHEFNC